VILALPPTSQLNTPYPSVSYLARHLEGRGVPVQQRDLGLEVMLRLLSRQGLRELFDTLEQVDSLPEPAWRALALAEAHLAAVAPVVRFLQGREPSLAHRLVSGTLLPGSPRVDRARAAPASGLDDQARLLATRHVEDLVDLVAATVDPGFQLIRYQHHLAVGPAGFEPLAERLDRTTLVDRFIDELCDGLDSGFVGLSVPFPGQLYGALRIGRRLRQRGVYVVLGGGYVSTELREVSEPRLWDCADALVYDDGEGPLDALLAWRTGERDRRHRTRTRDGLHHHEAPRPLVVTAASYGDLPLRDYLQLVDTLNPAHRLWSDGRWNKLTLAHGCYWKRCAFCDVSLDYVGRYEPQRVDALLDAVEELVEATGDRGFHLVDEAAPPRLLRDFALGLLERGLVVSWWGNVRFESAFTPDLCRLLAASGCIAITGGLEVASDRLLARMDKGVTVEQVARAAWAFQRAGILVHAYLMYGFPTQTAQETIDSAELVRQLFATGALQSAFWHRFVATAASPVGLDPARFGVTITRRGSFAANDLSHHDPTGADHDRFDSGLERSLAAWMAGRELGRPVHTWFEGAAPTTEPPDRIAEALSWDPAPGRRLVWLGGAVLHGEAGLVLHHAGGVEQVQGDEQALAWLVEVLEAQDLELADALAAFPGEFSAFAEGWAAARRAGLVAV